MLNFVRRSWILTSRFVRLKTALFLLHNRIYTVKYRKSCSRSKL